ncbi:MAG: hypothetical protein OHK0029_01790 [Armatimonadaceae bacterium]
MTGGTVFFALCLWILTVFVLPVPNAHAEPLRFDFKDIKETNAVSLTIDAAWEPVVGYADGISGNATFDPKNPRATTGEIRVDVQSIRFSNDGYTQTARGYALEGDKYPQIVCRLKRIVSGSEVRTGVYEGKVEVDFTCHGITKALTIPLRVSYLPGVGSNRDPRTDGDLLVVRSNFTIQRKDFDIAQGVATELVSDEIEIRVAIVGTCIRKKATDEKTSPETTVTSKPETPIRVIADGKEYEIAERMAFHNVPGLSVAVIRNHELTAIRHWGKANAETPISDDTLYQVGAMGHPMVTVAVLRAVQQGTYLSIPISTSTSETGKSRQVTVSIRNVASPCATS